MTSGQILPSADSDRALAVGVALLALGWLKSRRGRHEVTSAERSAAESPIDPARAD
jgi:hypothetical protein